MLQWLSQKVVRAKEAREDSHNIHRVMKKALSFGSVIPPEKLQEYQSVMDTICRQSFDLYDRVVLLECIQSAFCVPNSDKEWRKIVNGMRVMSALIEGGSELIFSEVLEGKHFDILQQMVFLVNYVNTDDRVGKVVRSLARDLRGKLILKFDVIQSQRTVGAAAETEDEILASIPTPVLDITSVDLL